MSLIIPANSLAGGGYAVDNSLRFNSGSSDYLSITPASNGNRKTWTYSFWIKRSVLEGGDIFSSNNGAGAGDAISWRGDDKISLNSFSGTAILIPNALYRDVSAWYAITISVDTTQATASDRVKIYINGEQITSFSTETYPSLNADASYFNTTTLQEIGKGYSYYNGYMADVYFIDGQQLTPTDFGEFDADSGVWKPIAYEGTYGTNGFFLEFQDSGALGTDSSGEGNNFTVNNLTSIDQVTDTPTNNFATQNPLTLTSATLSDGNLHQTTSYRATVCTLGVSEGKWYWEQKWTGGSNEATIGFALDGSSIFHTDIFGGSVARGAGYVTLYTYNGQVYNEGSTGSSLGSFSSGDIIGWYLDATAGDLRIAKDGILLNSGNAVVSGKTGRTWFPMGQFSTGDVTSISYNYGNPTFTIALGNSDANGYGNFEYSPTISGVNYYALNTKNLAEFG